VSREAPGERRPRRLRLGRVVRPHGLKGEVVVHGTPLRSAELLAVGKLTLARPDGQVVGVRAVATCRDFGRDLLVRFAGVEDVDAAGELRGLWLEAERAALPDAGEGAVYHYDLLDLEVVDESGRELGRVVGVIDTGAHEVLEVAGPAGEILVPYHAGTVLGWDPAARRLTVRLPAGLEEVYRRADSGGADPEPGGPAAPERS
jgi:16S rRNA processing protein RimM